MTEKWVPSSSVKARLAEESGSVVMRHQTNTTLKGTKSARGVDKTTAVNDSFQGGFRVISRPLVPLWYEHNQLVSSRSCRCRSRCGSGRRLGRRMSNHNLRGVAGCVTGLWVVNRDFHSNLEIRKRAISTICLNNFGVGSNNVRVRLRGAQREGCRGYIDRFDGLCGMRDRSSRRCPSGRNRSRRRNRNLSVSTKNGCGKEGGKHEGADMFHMFTSSF